MISVSETKILGPAELRQEAEAKLKDPGKLLKPLQAESGNTSTLDLIHELRLHQIELEMQNDELRLIQADLELSQAGYIDLYENAPVGYCAVDKEAKIKLANRTFLNMLGVSLPDIIGKPITHFIYAEDQDDYYLFKQLLEEPERVESCELRIVCKDGTLSWVQLAVSAKSEQKFGFYQRFTFSNIDRIKIAEDKLVQANRLAAMGAIASNIVKEVNSPLAEISNVLGPLTMAANNSEKFKGRADSIKNLVGKIASIMNGLQKFSESAQVGNREKFVGAKIIKTAKLANIVRDSLTFANLISERQGLKISLKLDESAEIFCNPMDIQQVIVSLVTNSLEAIHELTNKWVQIEVWKTPDAVMMKISDSGNSLNKENSKNIFDPFYTTKELGQGHGQGLSLAKSILAEHGASIRVVPNSMNTEFEIEFPTAAK